MISYVRSRDYKSKSPIALSPSNVTTSPKYSKPNRKIANHDVSYGNRPVQVMQDRLKYRPCNELQKEIFEISKEISSLTEKELSTPKSIALSQQNKQ